MYLYQRSDSEPGQGLAMFYFLFFGMQVAVAPLWNVVLGSPCDWEVPSF